MCIPEFPHCGLPADHLPEYHRHMRAGRLLVLVAALASACSGTDSSGDPSEQGAIGQHCYPNGTCNVGLGCADGVCSALDAAPPDAQVDASICDNDSQYEPNDTLASAFDTHVANEQKIAILAGLAILPSDGQRSLRDSHNRRKSGH